MTAEFAAALPAALLCLALCLGAVHAAVQQSRLVAIAASEARQLGRGEAVPATAGEPADRSVRHEGGLVCVTLSAPSEAVALGRLGVTVSTRQCAIDEEGVVGEERG